ncbi:DUF4962 domain-containing protein [Maridesulfovibrio sp.]|uniref:DUF4962 domain-containing protein n=1 Tax=Maridesulfovibrio sp. TaxID=2795000 RepID=UPI002A18B35B|nr:DUF4962 domain-containing protein [Maridesulfovibrio sp.]
MRFKQFLLIISSILFVLSASVESRAAADYSVFNKRPRLYFNSTRLEELRSLKDQKPYSDFLKIVRKRGRNEVGSRVPNNLLLFDASTIRRPADGLLDISFYYLITGEPSFFHIIEDLLHLFSTNPDWAGNSDMGPAHVLFSMSLAYDWFYDKLSPGLRLLVRDAIAEHAENFYDLTHNKKIWWSQDRGLLQNHNYVNVASMAIAGIALYGEDKRAVKWLDEAERNFDAVLGLLSPDGASHEGVSYWSYGTLWLLNYYMALVPAQGLDKVRESGFFRNTARYRLYASLPGFLYNVDYADSLIIDYYGPGCFLRCLASIFKDGHAQWLASKVERERRRRTVLWQDYLWYDPSVEPESPDNLPLFGWFDNLGILLSRSSWGKDASLVMFKAGPPQGYLALSKGNYPGSHIHPDEGSFCVWQGRKGLVMDDGYVLKKLSSSHNLLTFGKFGQLGEGGTWFIQEDFRKSGGRVSRPRFVSGNGLQAVEIELAWLYPPAVRPKSWKRAFVVLDGADVFIRDKVVPSGNRDIEYYAHLSREARRSASGICLDYGSGYSFDFMGKGFSSSLRRYSLPTQSMGKSIPRIGMLYTATSSSSAPVFILSSVARAEGGCTSSGVIKSYDQASDIAEVETAAGRYRIDFSSLSVTGN